MPMNQQVIELCQTMLKNIDGCITRDHIAQKVDEILTLPTFQTAVDRDTVIKKLEEKFTVWTEESQVLSNNDNHTPWLPGRRGDITWSFWNRYKLSIENDLPPAAVDSISEVTDKILERLENPESDGPWDRRGLVMGNVQSGKTANYTGLICKAADAGYKVIVVLAGLHNNLRSQTQIRLDSGFLGYRATVDYNESGAFEPVGVGLLDPSVRADSVTTRHDNGDFNRVAASHFAINPGGRPLLFVVKKNVSVLKNLLRWIRSSADVTDPETGRKFHRETPLLVIDDESDQASVDTGAVAVDEDGKRDDEHDPTSTNKLIRSLLFSFAKSAYVGYTATPFANIYIHEHNKTKNEGEDLFPRSFIVNIPPPSNYMGPARIFGVDADESVGLEEQAPLPISRAIDDYAVKRDDDGKPSEDGVIGLKETMGWMPPRSLDKTEHVPFYEGKEQIPPSLRTAMRVFILATAVREIREGKSCHNSMLIHVTRFTKVQGKVAEQIAKELSDVRNRLQHGDGARTPSVLEEFKQLWTLDFEKTSSDPVFQSEIFGDGLVLPSWNQVEAELSSVALSIEIRSINGSAGDVLDYDNHTERGLNVIAVGADKLSRGLTLEGLTVSYFLRASKMYDTLMQMGRWFGYKSEYADVCRLYTPVDLIQWFTHIAAASEELRLEFDYMVNVGGTPKDYGLKVRSHPVLLVTSAVKMRAGTGMKLTYAGDISETIIFHTSPEVIKRNWEATSSFVEKLGPSEDKSKFLWAGVSAEEILEFLGGYKSHPDARRADTRLLASYIKRQVEQNELIEWSVLLVSSSDKTARMKKMTDGKILGLIQRSQYPKHPSGDRYTIRRLLNPADESKDLLRRVDNNEYEKALVRTVEKWELSTRKDKSPTPPSMPSGRDARLSRPKKRGFLVLYPLDSQHAKVSSAVPIMGMAISFPSSNTAKEISYTANNIFMTVGDIDNI